MNIGNRIKQFIELNYSSQLEFAELFGIDRSNLNRYIQDRAIPGGEVLMRFSESGMSIDWLLTGNGSMYAPNARGTQLQELRFATSDKEIATLENAHTPINRIKYWIDYNYFSAKHFCIALDYDYVRLMEIYEDNQILENEFLVVLKKAGCNLNWILKENGDMYSKNPAGSFLKREKGKRNNLNGNGYHFDEPDEKDLLTKEQVEALKLLARIISVYEEAFYENNNK